MIWINREADRERKRGASRRTSPSWTGNLSGIIHFKGVRGVVWGKAAGLCNPIPNIVGHLPNPTIDSV